MSNFIRCHKNHPYRPTAWRWERAQYLRELKKPFISRRHDDRYVLAARDFQEALDQCADDIQRYELLDRHEALYYAYELWDSDSSGEYRKGANPARYEIEARLLAREPIDVIAQKVAVESKVIAWYERLFFNVSDRLDNTGYVMHQVMGPSVHKGLTDRDYDVLWKLLGYFTGPIVLDAFITSFIDPQRVDSADKMTEFCTDWTRSSLNMKAAVAARTIKVDSFTQSKILELHAQFKELEHGIDRTAAHNTIVKNIGEMMTLLPFSVGKQEPSGLDQKLVMHYKEGHAAELRADELLKISMGEMEPPDLSAFKFPEPTESRQ